MFKIALNQCFIAKYTLDAYVMPCYIEVITISRPKAEEKEQVTKINK